MANTTPPEPEEITSVELEWSDVIEGYVFRINGRERLDCAIPGGHVPASNHPEDLKEAVVAIAYQHGLSINTDDVAVEGLHASYEEPVKCTERTRF